MEEAEGDGGGGSGGEEEEAGQGDEDGELWEALGAVWEFVFLQARTRNACPVSCVFV